MFDTDGGELLPSQSKSSLQRYYAAMVQSLPNAVTASEVDITAWMQEFENSVMRQTEHTALRKLEEDMLVQWIEDAANIYQGVDSDNIKDKAREIIKSQRDIEWDGKISNTHIIIYILYPILCDNNQYSSRHWLLYVYLYL